MARGEVTALKHADRDPFDFPPVTDKVDYLGISYLFRELTVAETDQAREDSIIEEKFDGRLMTRFMICTASVEPKIDLEQLGKLPQSLYVAIVDCVNDLNDPEALKGKKPGES